MAQPPQTHFQQLPIPNGAVTKVPSSDDQLPAKYSHLKRRYFELERVRVSSGLPDISFGSETCLQKYNDTLLELQRSGERNAKMRQERA